MIFTYIIVSPFELARVSVGGKGGSLLFQLIRIVTVTPGIAQGQLATLWLWKV